MRAVIWLAARLQAQRGALFPWAPVFMGTGITLYFAQAREPSVTELWAVAAVAGLMMLGAWRWSGTAGAILLSAAALSAGGFALAGWRASRLHPGHAPGRGLTPAAPCCCGECRHPAA